MDKVLAFCSVLGENIDAFFMVDVQIIEGYLLFVGCLVEVLVISLFFLLGEVMSISVLLWICKSVLGYIGSWLLQQVLEFILFFLLPSFL